MNKIRFANYPQVLNKIKKLIPGELIRYRTTLQTHAGDWQPDVWFSDIESIFNDRPEQTDEEASQLPKFVVGAEVSKNINVAKSQFLIARNRLKIDWRKTCSSSNCLTLALIVNFFVTELEFILLYNSISLSSIINI